MDRTADIKKTLPSSNPAFDIVETSTGARGSFVLYRMHVIVRAESREIVERHLSLYLDALSGL